MDLDTVRTVLRDHGVVFALLFGSHAEGTAQQGSDVDLAVWSENPVDDWHLRGSMPGWQADTRKRYLDESFRRDRFRRDFVRAHG